MFARKYFIVAPSYHGVTLLAKLINTHPQVVCLGDTYPTNLFDQGCGCGKLVSQCPFWIRVKEEVGASRYLHLPAMLPARPAVTGAADRRFFQILPISVLRRIVPTSRARAFASEYESFLQAVYANIERARLDVFVDGVKSLSRLRALIAAGCQVDGVLHVVRDPADFVASTKSVNHGGLGTAAKTALEWRRFHRLSTRLARHVPYLRIDYETLCARPDAVLSDMFRFLGVPAMTMQELRMLPPEPWHFTGNNSVYTFNWHIEKKKHTVSKAERFVIEAIARPTKI